MTPTNLAGPLVIPGDEEREEIRKLETKIDELKTAIRALESQQLQRGCDEQERVRPILDKLYAQILVLQKKMADCWRNYHSRVMQSRRQTETAIAEIQNKVSVLEQTNFYAYPLVGPIL